MKSRLKFCVGTLLVISSLTNLIFFSFPVAAETEKTAAEKFQESLQYANSLRSTIRVEDKKLHTGKHEFKPHEVFKDQKGGYSEDPTEGSYYANQKTVNLQNTANHEMTKSDSTANLVGKTVFQGFQARPVFKVTKNDQFIAVKDMLLKNAQDVLGDANCVATHTEKTCSEAVRTVKRICDSKAEPQISVRDIVCPNCRSLIIVQNYNNYCPPGYNQDFAADMVRSWDDHWDDIRFCTKPAAIGETAECYSGGYYVARIYGGDYFGSGNATVPKKLHSRIRINNVYYQPVIITVVNNTTGQTLVDKGSYSNGAVIELPYSETQDQNFSFYAVKPDGGGDGGGMWWNLHQITGTAVLYIEHINREKVATVTWKESCHDI